MKVFLIILELICLTVMGFFMMKLQTSLSLKSYRLDMEKEIQEMDRLLADRKEEEAQTIATDNAIYQSKAESIAFMANHEDGFEATDAKMREYADLLDVDNVLIVDQILYHPNEAMIGRDALSSGISVSDLEDGNFSWMTLNGKRFYAGVTELDRVYYIAAVPEAEIEGARNLTVGIILFIFFAVMTIVITYGVLVMYDYEKKGDQGLAYVKLGRLGYNKVVGGKTVSLSVVGFLFLLVVTYYMQTLFALSNQSISNHQRVNDVEETILRYESQEEILREQYNDWYLSKCQTAAYIIENNPSLAERETLKLLADTLQVTNIYVFDQKPETKVVCEAYAKAFQ